jgi:hypothetical protein
LAELSASLEQELAEVKPKGFICCWCGHKSLYVEGEDPLMIMAEHAALCQKSPLFTVMQERDAAKSEVDRLSKENEELRHDAVLKRVGELKARLAKLEKVREAAKECIEKTTCPVMKDPFGIDWKWYYGLSAAIYAAREK